MHLLILFFMTIKVLIQNRYQALPIKNAFDEDLGSFFESLPARDQKIIYTNEVYNRHYNKIKRLTDANLELLRTSRLKKKSIDGPTDYEVLSQQIY
jgi:hypothetical protein